jgi:DNA-binding transcriptional regulator YiaG
MTTTYKNIPGTCGAYSAGSDGSIRSNPRKASDGRAVNGRIIKQLRSSNGYLFFQVRSEVFSGSTLSHRAVLSAFSEEMKELDVNHKNGIKTDNRLENLEWNTRSENQLHAANNGLKPTGEKSHLAKLNSEQVREIRELLKTSISQSKIARLYGVAPTTISKIKNNKKWKQLQ